MEPAPNPPSGESLPQRRHDAQARAPWWYYLVIVGTAGTFAWVPFLHAAIQLRIARARLLALIFGGADALSYVLLTVPSAPAGTNDPSSTLLGLLMVGTVVVGCVMAATLRRVAVDDAPNAATGLPSADPAVRAVLASRARRDEARQLAERDRPLARELHIGRPDLNRTYDDGGLVDLNSAPADVIAQVCGIPTEVADAIVTARTDRAEPFTNVDELFVMADLPLSTWELIRDRAVFVL